MIEEGTYTTSNDPKIGFLQTEKAFYVFDFQEGVIRKAVI